MSISYLFMEPLTLPLSSETLGDDTVRKFSDSALVRGTLSAHLPDLSWETSPLTSAEHGRFEVDGVPYEFSLLDTRTEAGAAAGGADVGLVVSLRCSGRVDSAPFVQQLCDSLGWIAFDDRVMLFQPHHPPVPA